MGILLEASQNWVVQDSVKFSEFLTQQLLEYEETPHMKVVMDKYTLSKLVKDQNFDFGITSYGIWKLNLVSDLDWKIRCS